MNHRVFVANRGEIAVRIIEACDRLGFETVLRHFHRGQGHPGGQTGRPGAGCWADRGRATVT